jgi:dipeptidyl aminopeptidase/acylaminoacyl peptidase
MKSKALFMTIYSKISRNSRLTLILVTTVFTSAVSQDPAKSVVTTDLMNIATASALNISPDGRQAVGVVTRKATRNNGTEYYYTSHLYLLDLVSSAEPLPLTFGDRNDSQPEWSPDGKKIAFIRTSGDAAQIWILPMTGGEAFPLTKVKYGASSPKWSPDGRAILFTSAIPFHAVEGDVPWNFERPGRQHRDEPAWRLLKDEEKKGVKSSPDGSIEEVRAWLAKNASDKNPRVLTRLQFQGELDLDVEERFSHLFVISSTSGSEAKQLTSGYQSFSNPAWSPDGTTIICSSEKLTIAPDYNRTSSLWTLNPDGKNLKEFLKITDKPLGNPSFSPDGKSILFSMATGEGFLARQNDIGTVGNQGGVPVNLTKDFDRDVQSFVWSTDGKTIYFNASVDGDIPLYSISVKGGNASMILGGDAGVMDFSILSDKLLYARTEVQNPWEVILFNLKDKKSTQLTQLNSSWIKARKISPMKEFWITRPDGIRVQYWVIEPAGRVDGKKYPTILNIHGGPTAMWGPSAFSMWHEFQLEAAWGYGVVFCNPRGSGGYGDAFKKANQKDWGKGPAGDILASLEDAIRNHAWIDESQLFAEGGSYAGYMVAWLIGHDQRFKAANAQRGVYDLSTFMGEGNAWRLVPDYFGGYPWEQETKKLLDSESPITYVNNINTPLLIIHGDQDLRTGVIQSEMLYKSLKILGKPVEYIRYPKEGHELTRSGNPGRMMDHLLRVIEFFERYAKHPDGMVSNPK